MAESTLREEKCPTCQGWGYTGPNHDKKCATCKGTGNKSGKVEYREPKLSDLIRKEAAGEKMNVECQECGKKFSVSAKNSDPKCPKCGGVDVDVA